MIRAAMMLASLLMCGSAVAQETVLINATLCDARGCVPHQNMLMRDDKIISVGPAVPDGAISGGARRVDATGRYVTPGLIDSYTHLGTLEIEAVDETNDSGAKKAAHVSAAFDVQWAVNPAASAIAITRIEGVTRAVVAPGAGEKLFQGYGALIHLGDAPSLVVRPRAFQAVNLGEEGAQRAGGSRASAVVTFENALREAERYSLYQNLYQKGGHREALTNRLDTEALVPVVMGRIPLLVIAERVSDIRNMIRLKRIFPHLRLILAGASEAWRVAPELAAASIPVLLRATDNVPIHFEQLGATMANAARLHKAGVVVALGSFDDQQNARLMAQYAANLTSLPGPDALTEAEALSLITTAPAQIFGLNTGILAPGKTADVVMWDGPPLDIMSTPVAVWINGAPVALESRQTKLRDRYLPIAQRALPRLPFQYRP